MNREKLARTIRTLRIFIDRSLAIDETRKITGFHYNKELLNASAYNTYLETISNKTDSLYSLIKEVEQEMIYWSYLDVVKLVSKKFELDKKEEKKIVKQEYHYYKTKHCAEGETYLAFLKQIFDKKIEKELDWAFATNVDDINLNEIIKTYKKRWRIENAFKVQDDALIKCKSFDMNIRFFILSAILCGN